MVFLELFYKLDASVYTFRLEFDEVQSTAFVLRSKFSGEVD